MFFLKGNTGMVLKKSTVQAKNDRKGVKALVLLIVSLGLTPGTSYGLQAMSRMICDYRLKSKPSDMASNI